MNGSYSYQVPHCWVPIVISLKIAVEGRGTKVLVSYPSFMVSRRCQGVKLNSIAGQAAAYE